MTGATVLSARWILPIDRPPIDGGWVEISGGEIVRLARGRAPAGARDLGDVALMPGLVNAHTHLELSWLAGRVRPAESMVGWIRSLIAARVAPDAPPEAERAVAAAQAAATMRDTGTVLAGDVTNTLTTVPALHGAGLSAVLFHEVLGFNQARPARAVEVAWTQARAAASGGIIPAVVAHAPYSVAPSLFSEIARRRETAPLSVHLGESAEEIEFLRSGHGPFRRLLEDLGVWNDGWEPPGGDPIDYLDRLGYLVPGLLAVHAVHLSRASIEHLCDAGGVVVTCPRSNVWVGGGIPNVSRFYASGLPVAIGTDSLASAPTLNLFDELAEFRRIAPDVAPESLLDSATRAGAEALGFGRLFGTIAPGKRSALIAVDVPSSVTDVEEYLVSAVPAAAIRRVS